MSKPYSVTTYFWDLSEQKHYFSTLEHAQEFHELVKSEYYQNIWRSRGVVKEETAKAASMVSLLECAESAIKEKAANSVYAESQRWEERFKTAQADASRYRQLLIALTHQIGIGTFVDEYGHQAKMLLAYRKAREALWPNP